MSTDAEFKEHYEELLRRVRELPGIVDRPVNSECPEDLQQLLRDLDEFNNRSRDVRIRIRQLAIEYVSPLIDARKEFKLRAEEPTA